MHGVVETPTYLRSAKQLAMTAEEMASAVELVSRTPQAGDVIQGTGGARKLRLRGRGKGKSGAYRLITYYAGEDIPAFLLDVYSKSDKINLTQAERNELRTLLAAIAADYREGTRRKMSQAAKRRQQ
jgi:hypothetical protein